MIKHFKIYQNSFQNLSEYFKIYKNNSKFIKIFHNLSQFFLNFSNFIFISPFSSYMQDGFLIFLKILKSRLPFFRGRCPLHPRYCGGLFLLRRLFLLQRAISLLRRAFITSTEFHILSQSPFPSQSFCEKRWLNPLFLPKKGEFTLYSYNWPYLTTYQRCGFKKQKKYYCAPLPYPLQPSTVPGMHLIWYILITNKSISNHQFLAIFIKKLHPPPLMTLMYPRYGFNSINLAQ